MRTVVLSLVLLIGLLTSACDGPVTPEPVGTRDCTTRIKADGIVFSSYGATRHHASKHGVALEAECEDVGADARGSVFTDRSRTVTIYRIDGYPPSEVLGVKDRHLRQLAVFVADTVSRHDRDRILRELARGGP